MTALSSSCNPKECKQIIGLAINRIGTGRMPEYAAAFVIRRLYEA